MNLDLSSAMKFDVFSAMKLDLFAAPTVSMSLEGYTLRLLETRGRRVQMWANIPLIPGLVKGGMIRDPGALGQVIGDTFKAGGISKRKVFCALNVPQAVSRIFMVPRANSAELAKAVDKELRRLLPAAREDSYIYWQPVQSNSQTQQQVYALTVPKEPLLTMVSALKVAGIRPYSMDLRTHALARSVNQKDAILANLESNSADVVIIVDDIPVMTRSVHLGDEPSAITAAQERLLGELTRSLSFYNDTNRANALPPTVPIYLTGDLASDPDLVAPVESATGHPVSSPELPLQGPDDFPSSQYMVNIGLALKEL